MRQIRSELPYDVDDARRQVRQLTDWRYQFRKHPAAIMTAAAVVGYLLVPQAKENREIVVHAGNGDSGHSSKPARKGVVSGVAAAAATIALRSAVSMLTRHLSDTLLGGTQRPAVNGRHSSLSAQARNDARSEVPS